MPVFVCYRGDCDHLALQRITDLSAFVTHDALGRQWLCVQTALEEIPRDALAAGIAELLPVQALAHKLGLSREGTQWKMLDCSDEASMRRRLILGTYPPAQESGDRLQHAGWRFQGFTERIGESCSLTLTNGPLFFTARGETREETCYRAAQALAAAPGAEEGATMTLTAQAIPVPLRDDGRGGMRVGTSRVSLDVVIAEYERGADAESIAHDYPTLELADVHAVIAFYLRNRDKVAAYLTRRRSEADELRRKIEAAQPDAAEFRARLLARRAQLEQGHASPAQ